MGCHIKLSEKIYSLCSLPGRPAQVSLNATQLLSSSCVDQKIPKPNSSSKKLLSSAYNQCMQRSPLECPILKQIEVKNITVNLHFTLAHQNWTNCSMSLDFNFEVHIKGSKFDINNICFRPAGPFMLKNSLREFCVYSFMTAVLP